MSIGHRFDSLDKKLGALNGHISKLVWAIIIAVVAAVAKFIIDGGLSPG